MTTVTCNGCFDGLHPGHLFFLGYAKAQGDRLIVGINADDYIRRHKKRKPLLAVGYRKKMLEALGVVDEVRVIEESNPTVFIRNINPDVHCTGAEYEGGCPEENVCLQMQIKLIFVPRTEVWSSSSLTPKELRHTLDRFHIT